MYILNCSKAEIQALIPIAIGNERYYYPSPLVQKRLHSVYLRTTTNLTNKEISLIIGRHPNTVTKDIKCYLSEGITGLKSVKYGTNSSELLGHKTTIEALFKEHPPATIKEAQYRIEELTNIWRSATQVRCFMKLIGLKRYKTGHIPAKADRTRQEQWLETRLNPIIKKAEKGEIHLLFMDAALPIAIGIVLTPFLCFLWSFKRVFIKAPTGRKRLNVLGAVNAITKKVYFTAKTTNINA